MEARYLKALTSLPELTIPTLPNGFDRDMLKSKTISTTAFPLTAEELVAVMFNNSSVAFNITEGNSSLIDGLFTFQAVIFAVICLIGLIGNTLVIYVVVRFSKMQTVTNMYILNLAIADECFLIGIPMLMVTIIMQYWIFGNILCKVYMILTSMNQFTSSTFLCIMSADRYIAVCHPISSPKWRTPFISTIISAAAWVWSLMLVIPIILYSEEVTDINNKTSCTVNFDISVDGRTSFFANHRNYSLYIFFFSFAIPLILIIISYYFVIMKLRTVGPQNKSKEKKRSHRKVTNLVLAVITVYIICWLPYWVGQIAMILRSSENGEGSSSFETVIHILCSCLTYSNSAVNPILYAFLSDNFKKSFLKACSCAVGADVNATLHMENSVFPRRNKQGSQRFKPARGTSICPNVEDEGDIGPLVSKGDPSTSAITMTSRSNITLTSNTTTDNHNKDPQMKDTVVKNGVGITFNF